MLFYFFLTLVLYRLFQVRNFPMQKIKNLVFGKWLSILLLHSTHDFLKHGIRELFEIDIKFYVSFSSLRINVFNKLVCNWQFFQRNDLSAQNLNRCSYVCCSCCGLRVEEICLFDNLSLQRFVLINQVTASV